MAIEYLSCGAQLQDNDDHIAMFSAAGVTDVLVIDGGTSVADLDYIDPVRGDVAWFVQNVAATLEQRAQPARSQHDSVHEAIEIVRAVFDDAAGESAVPAYAWPIAALTWLRIVKREGRSQATLYSLGDCKTLLRAPAGAISDPGPFVNPQEAVLQAEIARLRVEGVLDPVERRDRMLPLLRARRASQNCSSAPSILCLQPRGPFYARTCTFDLEPGAALLVMTDGFYRLVDPYGLYADETLFARCEERGLRSMLDKLRSFEQEAETGERAVKSMDDASAVLWTSA